jgi:hypothetical protein
MDEEMILPNTNSRFYPDNVLQELIREEVVSKILERSNIRANGPDLTRFICTKAKKVFAVLLSCEQVPLITQFYTCKFTDDMLPVGPGFYSGSSEMESFSAPLANLKIVKDTFESTVWGYREKREFHLTQQWPFISPVFTAQEFRRQFHENCPMPFMEIEAKICKDSHFSHVEKRRVHRDHLQIGCSIVK